jgi:hypothetical protein
MARTPLAAFFNSPHLPQGALAKSLATSPMGKKKVKKRGRSGFLPYTHDIFF